MRCGSTARQVDDVTTHPAFKLMIDALARVYDQQNSDEYRDEMTYVEPENGVRTSISWLLPRSARTSNRKRRNSQLWNMLTWGQLGRSPDILAPYIINLVPHAEDAFSAVKHPQCDFGENVDQLLQVLPRQRSIPHPCAGRSAGRPQRAAAERAPREVPEDEEIALHVVEETAEGVIVTRRQAAFDRGRAQQRMLRLAVGDVLRPQRSALRAGLRHPVQLHRA